MLDPDQEQLHAKTLAMHEAAKLELERTRQFKSENNAEDHASDLAGEESYAQKKARQFARDFTSGAAYLAMSPSKIPGAAAGAAKDMLSSGLGNLAGQTAADATWLAETALSGVGSVAQNLAEAAKPEPAKRRERSARNKVTRRLEM